MSEPDQNERTASAQRHSRVRRGRLGRRLDATLVLAIVLPLVAAAALLATRPDAWSQESQSPTDAPLRSQTVVCPAPMSGDDGIGVTSSSERESGQVEVAGSGASAGTADLSPGRVTDVSAGKGEVVLSASGAVAPGLVAGRASSRPLAATDCTPPVADQWFTGVAAGPAHNSSIELTNPNAGSAVIDVTVLAPNGVMSVPELRGVAVPGHSSRSFELGKLIPRLGSLALHTTVVRGQVAVAVRDRSGQLAGSSGSEEWLPGQAAPSKRILLLGFPDKGEAHTLTLANGGDSQVTATVKLVTPTSVLSPADAPSVQVPPETVKKVELQQLLDDKVADDAYGIEVDATGPITAGLRTVSGGDLAVTAPGASLATPAALVLPEGTDKRVALAGATGVGAVTVVSRSAAGRELASKRVAVKPQQGAVVDVPAGAALVEVRPERTAITASVLLTGHGAAVVPFRQLVMRAEVPGVAPGLR